MEQKVSDARETLAGELDIAGWRVQISMLRISKGAETVKLEPKAMQVLVRLAESAGDAVTRQQLADDVWPGVIVGDDAITNAVNKLRKAFGEDRRDPKVIETIPKVGYRLIAPVAPAGASEAESGSGPPAATRDMERKLTAVLYADVHGYSRLMGEDEEGTHRLVREYLGVLTDTIGAHRGSVMHFAGDAVLADFRSAVDAVECAVAVQRELGRRNARMQPQNRVQFRIGINLGDVIVDRGEIYGDGVNVAARLESLADAGGICISRAVHDAVGTRLSLGYDFMGEQRVKNIAQPVGAYRVLQAPGAGPGKAPAQTRTRLRVLAVAVAVAGLLALLVWTGESPPEPEPGQPGAPEGQAELALGVAVLPFENLSGDADQRYFSDGISEDLITDLSRVPGLRVAPRNSSFRYRDGEIPLRQAARELGVRYVLSGSVRRAQQQVRVNAQLLDASDGSQVWADRYDGGLEDVFALQDRISRRILDALSDKLGQGPESVPAAMRTGHTRSAEAYDAYLKGMEYFRGYSPDDFDQAVAEFTRAVELDPEYSRAYVALAATYWESWKRSWLWGTGWPWASGERAVEFLAKAQQNPSPRSRQLSAEMSLHWRRFDEAEQEARAAVAMDPNDPMGYVTLAEVLVFSGRPAEVPPLVREAMRLDPHFPGRYLQALGLAELFQGEHAAAAENFRRAATRDPRDPTPLILLAAAQGHLGDAEGAKATLASLDALYRRNGHHQFTIDSLRNRWQFQRSADRERLFEGLRMAGAPEW